MAAPRELVEWVRKLGPEGERGAWVDVTRADWVPYLAVLRGFSREAILRTTCACAVETAGRALATPGHEGERVIAVLRAGEAHGASAFTTTEAEFADLRAVIIAHGEAASPPPWMMWAKLALELSRASARGNALIGVALAMRMLAGALPTRSGRPAHGELVVKFREKIMFAQ